MSRSDDDLSDVLAQFVESCGREYEFPAGGHLELLTELESRLFAILQSDDISDASKVGLLANGLDWSDCYKIVIFGVRLALLGARTAEPTAFRCGVLALAAGSPKVDWRDVLGAFAIFENCGKRLHVDFLKEIERASKFKDESALQSMIESFFSRSDEMRAVDAMGFVESGDGIELVFTRIQ